MKVLQPIYAMVILINFLVGLLLLLFFWGKNDQSARLWAYASFSLALGFGLVWASPWISPFIRYFGANFAGILSFFLFVKSVKCLTQENAGRIWIGVSIACLFSLSVLVLFNSSLKPYINFYVNWGFAFACLWGAFQLSQVHHASNNPYVRLLCLLFLISALSWVFRAIFAEVFNPDAPAELLPLHVILVVLIATLVLLRHVMYLLLRFGGAELEKIEIERLNVKLSYLIEQKNTLIKTLSTSVKANHIGGAVAGIVHELSQPIGTISLNTQLLIKDLGQPVDLEHQATILNHIQRDNRRASFIIGRLRSFYQKGNESYVTFNLMALVQDSIELTGPMFHAQKILLQSDLDPAVTVRGDPGEIEMVLVNLLNNALNALSALNPDSQIVLFLRQEDSRVVIDVQDNGHGVPKEFQSEIFTLFHSTKSDGLGVGLWLSRIIMENHGGSISLLRSSPSGSCFRATLPYAAPAQ